MLLQKYSKEFNITLQKKIRLFNLNCTNLTRYESACFFFSHCNHETCVFFFFFTQGIKTLCGLRNVKWTISIATYIFSCYQQTVFAKNSLFKCANQFCLWHYQQQVKNKCRYRPLPDDLLFNCFFASNLIHGLPFGLMKYVPQTLRV